VVQVKDAQDAEITFLRDQLAKLQAGLESIAAFPAPDPARDIAKKTLASIKPEPKFERCLDFTLGPPRIPTPGDVCHTCGVGWAVHPKRGAEESEPSPETIP